MTRDGEVGWTGSKDVVGDDGTSELEARNVTLGVLEGNLLPKGLPVLGVEDVLGSLSDEYRVVARGC